MIQSVDINMQFKLNILISILTFPVCGETRLQHEKRKSTTLWKKQRFCWKRLILATISSHLNRMCCWKTHHHQSKSIGERKQRHLIPSLGYICNAIDAIERSQSKIAKRNGFPTKSDEWNARTWYFNEMTTFEFDYDSFFVDKIWNHLVIIQIWNKEKVFLPATYVVIVLPSEISDYGWDKMSGFSLIFPSPCIDINDICNVVASHIIIFIQRF